MSLLNLVTLVGALAVASFVVATFAILGRAFWRSRRMARFGRRFPYPGPVGGVQPTTGFAPAGNDFIPASGVQR